MDLPATETTIAARSEAGVERSRTQRWRGIRWSYTLTSWLGLLAFAFVATLGVTGFVTVALHNWFHFNLYDTGFSIYTFWGLVIVYVYFQLPLMILVMLPALTALRREWREAATNLGAPNFTYWW